MGRDRQQHKNKLVSDINVVPYIDVMLVLLVVFMVTAPLLTEGIYVDLPEADGESVSSKNITNRIVVSVNHNGAIYLSINGSQSTQVSQKTLGPAVRKELQRNNRTEVYVKGDEKVLYGRVVQIMSLLQESGVPNIGLITRVPQSQG